MAMRFIAAAIRNKFIFQLAALSIGGLCAWYSWQNSRQFDLTVGGRNTLSPASQSLIEGLADPVEIVSYASANKELREQIRSAIDRFQRFKPDLSLRFVDPRDNPDQIQQLGIEVDGELMIHYQGRSESVQSLSETAITNVFYRLAVAKQRWIAFLAGHGERSPTGPANHDLGQFGKQLENKGYRILELKSALTGAIPDNASLLVIAGPVVPLLKGELESIHDHIERGGNLLWLQDSDRLNGLETLSQLLGIDFIPGMIVDSSSRTYGISNPAILTLSDYPPHPITKSIQTVSLLPKSGAIEMQSDSRFQSAPILLSSIQSWSETGAIKGHLQFNPEAGEKRGPLTLGLGLNRPLHVAGEKTEQRVVVVGDGDFLSNTYLGNGANLELGLNIVHWLADSGTTIELPTRFYPDQSLHLTANQIASLGIVFLIAVPALFLLSGFTIARKRNRA